MTKISEIIAKLDTETNVQTGSTFYRIGESDDVFLSIRFWLEYCPGATVLKFRLRTTPKIEVLNFGQYVTSKWPDIHWNTVRPEHASLIGDTTINQPTSAVARVREVCQAKNVGNLVFEMIGDTFPGITPVLSAEEFSEFYSYQIDLALGVAGDMAEDKTVVVRLNKFDFTAKDSTTGWQPSSGASTAPQDDENDIG